ncbi:hypothetical protein CEXT_376851 [Caerostris extrusa]|uniref:Uncharacterized protein n=1 Tax=Caerostris extrusa TaxID=172846 RepID=A0AAV4MLK9_CAEEX|nr:hypothetical protein CEXT_376851 [Caerostris extrusa]
MGGKITLKGQDNLQCHLPKRRENAVGKSFHVQTRFNASFPLSVVLLAMRNAHDSRVANRFRISRLWEDKKRVGYSR